MVDHGSLDMTYKALADPTRRAILSRLADGAHRVTQLAEPFDMSLNAVSKHIRVLERAGLVRRTIEGREHVISLRPEPLAEAADWLEGYRAFWSTKLDALEQFLRERRDRH